MKNQLLLYEPCHTMSNDAGDTFQLDIKCVLVLSSDLFQYGTVGGQGNAAKPTICTEKNACNAFSLTLSLRSPVFYCHIYRHILCRRP